MTPPEFQQLKEYYTTAALPRTLQYNEATMMNNVPLVVKSDLETLENYGLINTFAGSMERLTRIKEKIEAGEGTY